MPVIVIICVLALVGVATYYWSPESSRLVALEPDSQFPSLSENATTTENETTSNSDQYRDVDYANYQDGTYSHALTYRVPNNHVEDMIVTLTISDNNITGTELEFVPSNGTSEKYQQRFTDWHQPEVVGKPVNDVSLSRLGGASLTSAAFNEALANIKQQAAS